MLPEKRSIDASCHVEAPSLAGPEAAIREALLRRLSRALVLDPTAVILRELGICRASVRADVVLVNGVLHGFEIKSERDSLVRLPVQADYYSRVFDRATLVVARRHLDAAIDLIPTWWGVVSVFQHGTSMSLTNERRARPNPTQSARALAEFVFLERALTLLDARGAARGYRRKPRTEVWDQLCRVYTLRELASEVRIGLKSKSAQQSAAQLLQYDERCQAGATPQE